MQLFSVNVNLERFSSGRRAVLPLGKFVQVEAIVRLLENEIQLQVLQTILQYTS